MSSQKRHYAEIRKRFSRVRAVRMLGIRVSKLGPGWAILTLDTQPRHSHPEGIHGGVLAALADTALGMAIFTQVPASAIISTVEMKINYLLAHRRGRLRAEAQVLRLGKRLAVGEVEIRNSAGELVAKSLLTYSVRGPAERA